jgi:hypothetical protein
MLKLCAKDFVACRWWWLLVIAVFLLYWTFPFRSSLALMLGAVVLTSGWIAVALTLEDRYRTEAFYCSLPLRRSTIVLGRYVLAGILAPAGGILVFLYAHLLNSVTLFGPTKIALAPFLTVEGVTTFVLFMAVLVSLYLPFYFRYGLGRGTLAFAAAVLVLAAGIAGLGRLAVALFNLRSPLFTAEFLKDPGLGMLRTFAAVKETLSLPAFLAAVLALLMGAVLLSVTLSVRFYQKREF